MTVSDTGNGQYVEDEGERVDPLELTVDGRSVKLSILDLAGIGKGYTPAAALADTTRLAIRAEQLGYQRFWVAEHHGMPTVASSSPAVLIAHLASHTHFIRLGSGGVMLPNHAPLAVAEQFGTLEALYPGRIDMGIGRAPGSDRVTGVALRRRDDDLGDLLAELMHFQNRDFPPDHPYARIRATPVAPVPTYILGSSDYGARLAARMGLPFAFAYHFAGTGGGGDVALNIYRSLFEPSESLDTPYPMIGVTALAAETDEEAEFQAAAGALSMLLQRTRRARPIPTPEEAAAFPYTTEDREALRTQRSTEVVGTPESVVDRLRSLAQRFGVVEIMITTRVHSGDTRLRSFELIAEAVRASESARQSDAVPG